ncbi:hypothetical protein P4S72_02280 [Vibrio sp. PP-XX7]
MSGFPGKAIMSLGLIVSVLTSYLELDFILTEVLVLPQNMAHSQNDLVKKMPMAPHRHPC